MCVSTMTGGSSSGSAGPMTGHGGDTAMRGSAGSDTLKHGTGDYSNLYSISSHGRSSIDGLRGSFRQSLSNMLNDAPPSVRSAIGIKSGYRDANYQAGLFHAAVQKYGSESAARKWVAPPGHSEHGRGNAVDLSFGNSTAKNWVHENAAKYGMRFPMSWESWHIEPSDARSGGHGVMHSVAQSHKSQPGAGLSSPAVPATSGPGAGLSSPTVPATKTAGPMTAATGGTGFGSGWGSSGNGNIGPGTATLDAPTGQLEAALAAGEARQKAAAAQEGFAPVVADLSTSAKPFQDIFDTSGFSSNGNVTLDAQGRPVFKSSPHLAQVKGGVGYRA